MSMSNVLDIEILLNGFTSLKISFEKLAEYITINPNRRKFIQLLLQDGEFISCGIEKRLLADAAEMLLLNDRNAVEQCGLSDTIKTYLGTKKDKIL